MSTGYMDSKMQERYDALDVPPKPMSVELDSKLYAAALYVITSMWHDTMDELQRASLANQIVREIERRQIVS